MQLVLGCKRSQNAPVELIMLLSLLSAGLQIGKCLFDLIVVFFPLNAYLMFDNPLDSVFAF